MKFHVLVPVLLAWAGCVGSELVRDESGHKEVKNIAIIGESNHQ